VAFVTTLAADRRREATPPQPAQQPDRDPAAPVPA
jgi:hypothetical protein